MRKQFLFNVIPLALALSFLFCANNGQDDINNLNLNTTDTSVKATGAIAYIRNGSEIRLINPDGSNDRRVWTHPNAKEPLGLFDLAWRPDGKELAFSSAHNALFSIYHADLYSIRPDGSGFRKITNAPDPKDFNQYKKGTVTLTVRNNQYSFQQTQASTGIFIVNVIGAEEPQQITLPPGSSKTLQFKNVADFGNHAQAVVAISGSIRWFMPGTDVKAGTNTKAPDLIISGNGIELLGAFRPVWKTDGSRISYRNGLCLVSSVPASPPTGEMSFTPLFGGKHPAGACVWDWGPTADLKNQLIYSENSTGEGSNIFLLKEGGIHPGQRLTDFTNLPYQIPGELRWTPDGSGVLYSMTNLYGDQANIFYYDTRTKQKRQLTTLDKEFARRFSISPDGKWVVYEKCKNWKDYETVDIWIIGIDGSGERLLVKNGLGPSWSK